MSKGLPDGIGQGDMKKNTEADRNMRRGCMVIIMSVMMVFGSGVFAGWALTVIFGK